MPSLSPALTSRARSWLQRTLGVVALSGIAPLALGQATCPIESSAIETAKPNKLYLYFPTANDAGFPPTGCALATDDCNNPPPDGGTAAISPLAAFNIANLTSYTGTVGELAT